ncbi:hypothetical protein BDC45DRAFT_545755 [Circinella umbellata]|nr:hypothetical protein BDC45DRAFT_545755 [Circinella umbellata]
MGIQYKVDSKNDYLIAQLLVLFPGGDPGYFRSCLGYYETAPVERIAEKILNNGGHYPRLITNDNSNGDKIIHNNRTQQLNEALRLLATEFFPDCNVAYIREKLLKYDHSYVEQVANELLQEKAYPERLEYGKLDRSDLIKSDTYRIHAEAQLAIDYPQVWKSSIRAVLAENNWDYVQSYDQLQDMGSGGFWTTIRNFFRHWSFPSTSSSSSLFVIPSASSPSSSKIFNNNHHRGDDDKDDDNKEFEHDLQIIRRRALDIQSKEDAKIALEINEHEYDELITCQCCYGDYVIEQLTFCSEGTHVFCHECIQHYISEGLFGQGSLRGAARIPCISMENDCDGCFQHDILEKIVLSQDIWSAYQKSIFEENLRHSKTARCSACGYCELDESTLPLDTALQRLKVMMVVARWIMVLFLLYIVMTLLLYKKENKDSSFVVVALLLLVYNPLMFIIVFTMVLMLNTRFGQWNLKEDIETVYDRIACARRGSIFQCRNPDCRRLTCVVCHHIVRGLHKCWEKEQDGLRLYVEKAMADAVKRTVSS